MIQTLLLLPQNPAAARYPPLGLQPAQTDARFSTTPFGVIFERGHWHFNVKGSLFRFGKVRLRFKKPLAALKTTSNER